MLAITFSKRVQPASPEARTRKHIPIARPPDRPIARGSDVNAHLLGPVAHADGARVLHDLARFFGTAIRAHVNAELSLRKGGIVHHPRAHARQTRIEEESSHGGQRA